MAGLLHDVGKLYLLKALERLNNVGVAHAALEFELLMEIFQELHVDQGCRLMEHWNMPKSYAKVVAEHQEVRLDTNNTVLTVVRLVNAACKFKGIGLKSEPDVDLMDLQETSLLQLEQDELDDMLDAIVASQRLLVTGETAQGEEQTRR